MGCDIDLPRPVLAKGANGYIAAWIVKFLVEAGVTVHCAVCDPDNEEKVGHLRGLAVDAPGEVKLFKTDILIPGSSTEGMAGCGIVFHTASPFKLQVDDPKKNLINPAVNGTRNLLEEVGCTSTVTRIILTPSINAVSNSAECAKDAPGMAC